MVTNEPPEKTRRKQLEWAHKPQVRTISNYLRDLYGLSPLPFRTKKWQLINDILRIEFRQQGGPLC